jgi:hypothetical protein
MHAAILAAWLRLASPAQTDDDYREALDQLYDGSTDTAIEQLAALAESNPDDPLGVYFQALALAWKVEQRPETTALDRDLLRQIERVLALTETRLKTDPRNARARLARGGAYGLRSRFHLFRLKSRDAARAAEKMREELLPLRGDERLGSDAEFGLGLYDYYVAVLPRMASLLRALSGMPGGDRARGLAAIEAAQDRAKFHQVEASWQLYDICAYYEDDPDCALAAMRRLHERYPGAPLWALKLAEHERERTGRYDEAARVAREIVTASERGEANFGTDAGALGRLAHGEALLLDLRLADARRALLWFRNGFPEAPWLALRARLLLGRTLELEGDREAALVHYRAAAASTEKDVRKRAERALRHPVPEAEVKAVTPLAEARRHREAGRIRDAVQDYRSALDAWPACAEARVRVAEDELRRGRPLVAKAHLHELGVIETPHPPWVRPWTWLLKAYQHDLADEREAAVILYKLVLTKPYGDDDLAREAKVRLRQPFRRDLRAPATDGRH